MTTFAKLKDSYPPLWESARFRAGWKDKAEKAASGIITNRSRYQAVENPTGVPWFVVGLIHQMESDRNFRTHLHNGDPLTARTRNVPEGRPVSGNPPFIWSQSAIDAIRSHKLHQIENWPLPRIAYELERYNGFRSRTLHGINTPYLWSGTNHYSKGKYVRDNVWDPEAVSKQVGALAVLRALVSLDADVAAAIGAPAPAPVDIPPADPDTPAARDRDLNLRELQRRLSEIPFYQPADIDGEYGPKSRGAIQGFLIRQGVPEAQNWRGERLVVAGAQALCRMDGIDAGPVDGLVGPRTRYALEVYAGRKAGDRTPETWRDLIDGRAPAPPSSDPLPEPPVSDLPISEPQRSTPQRLLSEPVPATTWPTEAQVGRFFGARGENLAKLNFPYPMRLAWDLGTVVNSTSCHAKVRAAAQRALNRTFDHYGAARIRELRLDLYGGCLNVRKKEGGSSWSMHSWAIAFDFDPERNQLRWNHTRASFAKPVYKRWFEFWEEEGAISLGRLRDFDWMHVQFARL